MKSCIRGHLKDLKSKEKAVVSLIGNGLFRGNVLLSYIIDAFLLKDNETVPYSHSHYWESLQMAKTFQDLGYSVDVIHYTNTTFVPEKEYSVFIDVRWNMQRLAPLLNKDCIKIMHIDLCHMLFNNAAEAMRLLALQQRRKVTLQPRRFEMPNLGIEHADCGVVIGNKFTMNTFIYANKPLYRVPVFSSFLYPSPEGKDFGTSRRNFIWFGSGGLVRKGLDLVLEAFTAMPDYHLMVIGPVGQEKDFERAYHKELYETPNIHTVGWLDLSAPELTRIVKNCVGLIYPSCAEGQSGGVVICMHAGLIPIISYESGVDVEDFGVLLRDCSIEEIKNSIQMIAALPPNELKQRALKTWEYARANHTRDKFAEDYGRIVHEIVNKYRGRDLRGRLVRTALC
jgi:hypothetical protein